jgi:hypothetical protein
MELIDYHTVVLINAHSTYHDVFWLRRLSDDQTIYLRLSIFLGFANSLIVDQYMIYMAAGEVTF